MSYEMREFVRGLGIIAVFVTFAATAIIFLVCKWKCNNKANWLGSVGFVIYISNIPPFTKGTYMNITAIEVTVLIEVVIYLWNYSKQIPE